MGVEESGAAVSKKHRQESGGGVLVVVVYVGLRGGGRKSISSVAIFQPQFLSLLATQARRENTLKFGHKILKLSHIYYANDPRPHRVYLKSSEKM